MTRKSILQNTSLTLILVCLMASAVLAQQTTAFTYQGKLTDAGNPANGNYDLQFKLFDTVTVGTGAQQGAPLVRNPVAASTGIFSVQLDFGANVFSGADRYLEIGVRPAGNAGAYAVLAPRQPVTAAPYAIQTLNAQQLGGLPASGFVQNTATQQAGANFNIGGTGTTGNLNVNSAVSLGGSAPPAAAPAGQGRLYFDSASNKVKVSENGAPFVNLVGAGGVAGGGTTNSIPLWNAGTTLGNSLITQTNSAVQLPNNVSLAIGPQGNQVQFGSPNSETGMTISGAGGRADLRFDGTLKLVNGPGGIPPATNGIAITTAGHVGIGTANPTTKLHVVNSSSGVSAIYGGSTISSGVYGESIVPSSAAAGVVGKGSGSGSIGVLGASDIGSAVGVLGVSASPSGFGMYARNNSGGRAFFAEGNVAQSPGNGGLVKAMVYVNANGTMAHCYNGVTNASTGNCGFSITAIGGGREFDIEFGFSVIDRFFLLQPLYIYDGNVVPGAIAIVTASKLKAILQGDVPFQVLVF